MEKDKNQEIIDRYDYLSNAASMQEATGLVPANPFQDVMETYEDVFHYEPPKLKVERE